MNSWPDALRLAVRLHIPPQAFWRLSLREWTWIVVAAGFVLMAELMNTAIERVVDLAVGLRPDPLARQTKDLAAGFVLVASASAAIIGLLIFVPHLVSGWRVSAFAR